MQYPKGGRRNAPEVAPAVLYLRSPAQPEEARWRRVETAAVKICCVDNRLPTQMVWIAFKKIGHIELSHLITYRYSKEMDTKTLFTGCNKVITILEKSVFFTKIGQT